VTVLTRNGHGLLQSNISLLHRCSPGILHIFFPVSFSHRLPFIKHLNNRWVGLPGLCACRCRHGAAAVIGAVSGKSVTALAGLDRSEARLLGDSPERAHWGSGGSGGGGGGGGRRIVSGRPRAEGEDGEASGPVKVVTAPIMIGTTDLPGLQGADVISTAVFRASAYAAATDKTAEATPAGNGSPGGNRSSDMGTSSSNSGREGLILAVTAVVTRARSSSKPSQRPSASAAAGSAPGAMGGSNGGGMSP
jgi:hypothetical protein